MTKTIKINNLINLINLIKMEYLWQVTLFWAAGYAMYWLVLRRYTFFQLNRWYLLAVLAAGLTLPLLDWSWWESRPILTITLPLIEVVNGTFSPEVAMNVPNGQAANEWNVWQIVWIVGILIMLLLLLTKLRNIILLIRQSQRQKTADITHCFHAGVHHPFSFFQYLFWPNTAQQLSSTERQQILLHERTHIRQGHSLDVLLLELLLIPFWWHPLVYGFRRSLCEVHEFLADEAVIKRTSSRTYQKMLLTPVASFSLTRLAHPLFSSNLKNRFIMMTKPKTTRRSLWAYLLIVPIFFLLVFACEEQTNTESFIDIKEKSDLEASKSRVNLKSNVKMVNVEHDELEVHRIVDKMPLFPAPHCDNIEIFEERKKCSIDELLNFVYNHINYPESARKEGAEGVVVVSFVVDKDGYPLDAKIARSIHPACDAEALRVVEEMPKWKPGMQDGEPVNVQYHLPVRFKLE